MKNRIKRSKTASLLALLFIFTFANTDLFGVAPPRKGPGALSSLQTRIDELKKEIGELKVKIAKNERIINEKDEQIEEFKKGGEGSKETVDPKIIVNLEKKIKKLEKENDKLRSEGKGKSETVDDFIDGFKNKFDKIKGIVDEDSKKELTATLELLSEKKGLIEDLPFGKKIAKATRILSHPPSYWIEQKRKKELEDEKENKITDLEGKIEKLQGSSVKLLEMKEEEPGQVKEIKDLREELGKKETVLAELKETHQTAIEKQTSTIGEQNTTIALLTKDLEAEKEKTTQHKKDLTRIRRERGKHKKANDDLKKTLEAQNALLGKAKRKLEKRAGELTTAKTSLEELQSEFSAEETKSDKLEEKYNKIVETIRTAAEKLVKLKGKVEKNIKELEK